MRGFGARLKERARQLSLSDSEVARRLGLSQTRYSNYVNEEHEPDLATLARIVGVLGTTCDRVLGIGEVAPDDELSLLRARIASAAGAMDAATLRVVVLMVDAAASVAGAAPSGTAEPLRAAARRRR